MKRSREEKFGDLSPWAEPAWYNTISSPYYGESHRKVRDWARAYIDENVLPHAEDWEEAGDAPAEEVLKFARNGFVLQEIPLEYRPTSRLPGGVAEEDWDIFHFLVLSDEKARMNVGVLTALSSASAIGIPPVIHHGTEAQKQAWLPGIFSGETQFCLGATEPTGGSDLAALRTTAKKTEDGKYYVVNGNKKWITGALKATHMTTAVRTGGPGASGVSVLVIPMNLDGVSARKIYNSGANAGGSAWVTLENVKVPVENLIGKENQGFLTLMNNFNQERLAISIGMNRKARTCLSTAMNYAHDRVTFGKPLISNQIIRHKLAAVAKDVEAHWAWIEQLCYHVKINGWTSDLAGRIALSKVFGGQMLEKACREAQQILGGAGYQKSGVGSAVEQISRDLRMLVIGGGSEEIISDLAVKQEIALSKRQGAKL
ncbi:hypothetical protein MBLNU459_g5038t1 [Dothideomycetes sp. NU459]